MPKVNDKPLKLRPYLFHGLELTWSEGDKDAVGECPFCEKPDKFGVKIATGEFHCFRCEEKGNIDVFLRTLWDWSDKETVDYSELAKNRKLLEPDTLMHWGVVRSFLTNGWMVPGFYIKDRAIGQLYRFATVGGKLRLLATAGLTHKLFGLNLFDGDKDNVYICEGPWDAMILWELLGQTKMTDRGLSPTGNPDASLRANSNVIAVPGCNVFDEKWCSLFEGCTVCIMFDNDHPRVHSRTGKKIEPAGLSGTKRLADILSSSSTPPDSINYVQWGEGGYELDMPDGYDLRDYLTFLPITHTTPLAARLDSLDHLMRKLTPVPHKWLNGGVRASSNGVDGKPSSGIIECLPCNEYKQLSLAWKKAMKWTPGLDHALASMLASVTSTCTVGDQLWLKVIGPAACGKSTLCEALSVNKKHILAKSTIRGFHSGFMLDKDGKGQDNSLLAKLRDKTLITKDGDTLLQSPNLSQILSEGRDIYDGTSRTHYRNTMSKEYEGVRMTWLLCGTSSLRSIDNSELGERFLDCVIMETIDDDLEDEILSRVAYRADKNVALQTGGELETHYDPALIQAMSLTGGYIDFLKEDTAAKLGEIETPTRSLEKCTRLGKFVAFLRARPSVHQDENAERELASRLVSQHIRLAKCLALVLNRNTVDEVIMSRVRRITLDTSRGITLDITNQLYEALDEGLEARALAIRLGKVYALISKLLRFLSQIGVVEHFRVETVRGLGTTTKWRLTDKMRKLYNDVMGDL